MAINQVGNMTKNDDRDDNTRAEIEGLKASLADVEGELRWLKGILVATISFMMYLVWRYS